MALPTASPAKKQVASPRTGKKRKQPSSCASEGPAGPIPAAVGADHPPVRKRNKSPGVRVIGCRIYDSERGKTCHQCRQKTMDFTARCGNTKRTKPCPIQFCHKCLLNRYGEKAEEVAAHGDWVCPKCRGICNCSVCMKKRGQQPTGILVHTAKAIGCSSVSEMLQMPPADSESKKVNEDETATPDEPASAAKKMAALESKLGAGISRRSKGSLGETEKPKESARKNAKKKTPEESSDKLEKHSKRRSKNKSAEVKAVGKTPLHGDSIDGENKEVQEKMPKKSRKKDAKKSVSLPENDEKREDGGGGTQVSGKGSSRKRKTGDKKHAFATSNLPHPEGETQDKTENPEMNIKEKKQPEPVVILPQGASLKTVAGIEFQAEDVGHALQFLEFCSVFGKLLDIEESQPVLILRELVNGRGVRRGVNSKIVQFYIKVLSRIREERGDEALSSAENDGIWMKALQECVDEAHFPSDYLFLDSLTKSTAGYASLDSSKKLKILNFLCDEFLGTGEARSFIDEENTIFQEKRKEEREKLHAAKEESNALKKKLKDEVVQAMLELRDGAPLTVSDHEKLISQMKIQMKKIHADVLIPLGSSCKKTSSVLRTRPVLFARNGRSYWRLKGCDTNILLQDMGEWDSTAPKDQWFFYGDEEEKILERYLSSSRSKFFRSGSDVKS